MTFRTRCGLFPIGYWNNGAIYRKWLEASFGNWNFEICLEFELLDGFRQVSLTNRTQSSENFIKCWQMILVYSFGNPFQSTLTERIWNQVLLTFLHPYSAQQHLRHLLLHSLKERTFSSSRQTIQNSSKRLRTNFAHSKRI